MSSRDNPFEAIERMFEQMSRQFDQAARMWETEGGLGGGSGGRRMGTDVTDRGEELVVTADVPGFEPEDVELELVDDVLHVRASHEDESEGGDETARWGHRRQRSMGERIQLPAPVVADEAEATLRNGVLTVQLPKVNPEEGGRHEIDVE